MGEPEKNAGEDRPLIRISVRELVEFLLRSGDLDERGTGFDKEAMLKGSRLHRKLQRRMGSGYQPEVSLSHLREYPDFRLKIEGRADGIFSDAEGWAVDEIKGTYLDVARLSEPVPVHLAQAKCYAYLWARDKELARIRVQMTYCHLETEEIRRFLSDYSFEELREWYEGLMEAYVPWADFSVRWKRTRDASMQGLEFPFPYRPGQRDLVAGVYAAVSRGKQLFIQAPTGVGKTMSTIFPGVRAMGEGLGEKLFYLTAKTIARTVAEEAFALLKAEGLRFKALTLTAKEKLCPLEAPACHPKACPYAAGHYDRINDCLFAALTRGESYTREELLAYAKEWRVCPFELSLELSVFADGVICDYNYVLDPNASLKRFFGDNRRRDYLFFIDEAHNLVDRGREMYSALLYKEDVLELKGKVKPHSPRLAGLLEKVNRTLLEFKRECETCRVLENTGGLPIHLLNLMGEMERYLEEPAGGEEVREAVLAFYFRVRDFLNILELVDEHYVIYTELEEGGRFKLKLFCVNPAANLQNCLDKGRSAVFFSATLLPLAYHRSLFSTRTDDFAILAPSPFPVENRLLFLGGDVSSRYKRRGPAEYEKLAAYIGEVTRARQGNYMVFFPSHRLLQDVLEVYREVDPEGTGRLLVQEPSMGEQEREAFLSALRQGEGRTAFCVMGGIFSEGIDLTGDRLIGAIVVGTGLPQVGRERELLKNYYDARGMDGFAYAYRIPGMNKVLQAAGRVIRTPEDVGVIVLLDDRFHQGEYRSLFPPEWQENRAGTLKSLPGILEAFWKEQGEAADKRPRNYLD